MYAIHPAKTLASAVVLTLVLGIGAASSNATPINTAPKVVGGGSNDICLISQMGALYCAGDNYKGLIGPQNSGTTTPVDAMALVPSSAPVIDGSIGYDHSCMIVLGGAVQCRGNNAMGQLGTPIGAGTNDPNPNPITVPLPAAAVSISVAQRYSCAVLVTGAVYCWGVNDEGQLGVSTNSGTFNPNPTPMAVALPGPAVKNATGPFHACALLASGQTYCWGQNFYGQLGSSTNSGTMTLSLPLLSEHLAAANSIVAGTSHICLVSRTASVECAGINQYGQLFSAINNNGGNPNPVPPASGISGAVQVAAQFEGTCVLASTGDVSCAGNNDRGQLGNGTDVGSNVAHPVPVKVAGLAAPALALGAGANFACAALANGSAACWGNNGSGELGQPVSLTMSASPLTLPGINLLDAPAPIALTAGKFHLKFRASSHSRSRAKIRATATIKFSSSIALDAAHCTGKLSASFTQSKKTGKKTRTKRVAKASSKVTLVGGVCRAKLAVKLPQSSKGKRLRLKLALPGHEVPGAADVQPFAKTSSLRVPRHIR